MYSSGGSKLALRFITISILLIFSVSVLTFYWIIATSTAPSALRNLPLDTQADSYFFASLSNLPFSIASNSKPSPRHNEAFQSVISNSNLQSATVNSVEIKLSSESKYSDYKDYNDEKEFESSSSSSNKFRETEAEILMRVHRVSKLCKKYHLGKYNWANGSNDLNEKEPPTPLYSYFFWNRQRHLAWCPVYKAGSTSWLYNMMILTGYSEAELDHPPKQISAMAREVYGDAEPDPETLEQSIKLLIVRHPFERLVSAYRDKLANISIGQEHGTLHFYKKYGQKIVKKYRKDKSAISQMEPTWEEFVNYLLSTNLINYSDDHWLPAYYSCTPCLLEYDIIAKLETYSRDQEYIIYKAGLEGLVKPRWNHKTLKSNEKNNSISHKYFSRLSKSQIEKLYRKYWFDFELFGYDYKEYLKYAKDSE